MKPPLQYNINGWQNDGGKYVGFCCRVALLLAILTVT